MEREDIRVIYISDFALKGSGYLNISAPLCSGLTSKGFSIKALGLGYLGEEHFCPFSILPCVNLQEIKTMLYNLKQAWKPHIVVAALDIPLQEHIFAQAKDMKLPYIAITPLESDPLCLSWASLLAQMTKVFIISEFGTKECQKRGINATHLVVGSDTESWRSPTVEEKKSIRQSLAIPEDFFVILTVADNQERKNLSKSFEIVGTLKGEIDKKIKYLLVTRENSRAGWKLRDLALMYGINTELMIFERGLSFRDLWGLYAISDVFLLTSKAEGLGMPILEAMSVGVPVVATKTGAITELLSEDRGFLIQPEYVYIDIWGNSKRYMAAARDGVDAVKFVCKNKKETQKKIENARKYVEGRKWINTVNQLEGSILELVNEQKTPEKGI